MNKTIKFYGPFPSSRPSSLKKAEEIIKNKLGWSIQAKEIYHDGGNHYCILTNRGFLKI